MLTSPPKNPAVCVKWDSDCNFNSKLENIFFSSKRDPKKEKQEKKRASKNITSVLPLFVSSIIHFCGNTNWLLQRGSNNRLIRSFHYLKWNYMRHFAHMTGWDCYKTWYLFNLLVSLMPWWHRTSEDKSVTPFPGVIVKPVRGWKKALAECTPLQHTISIFIVKSVSK